MATLKNWRTSLNQPWSPIVGEREMFLMGHVYGHTQFKDGTSVATSIVKKVEDKGTHKEVTTFSGTVYQLYKEDINPEAEKKYPGNYERLK